MTLRLIGSVVVFAAIAACSSDDTDDGSGSSGGSSTGGKGSGGTSSAGTGGLATGGASTGGTFAGGTGGATSTGGSAGTGGGTASGGTGGGTGGQPLGAICANDSNCSQAQGTTVCCSSECTLAANCPAGTPYLPCESTGDCAEYGGGKICCEWGSGSNLMRFCTKQSGCAGQQLP